VLAAKVVRACGPSFATVDMNEMRAALLGTMMRDVPHQVASARVRLSGRRHGAMHEYPKPCRAEHVPVVLDHVIFDEEHVCARPRTIIAISVMVTSYQHCQNTVAG
jgi:hypothetical protein